MIRSLHSLLHKFKKEVLLFLFVLVTSFGFSQGENQTMQSAYIFDEAKLNQHSENLSAIYSVMSKYYKGVEYAKLNLLQEVFHSNWFMRDTDTPDEITLNVENKQKFIKRVHDHGPYPGYAKFREFASVGFANDNIAFVRINKKSTTSFFLYKLNGEWMLMDKLWATMEKSNSNQNRASDYVSVNQLVTQYFEAISNLDRDALNKLLHQNWDKKIIDNGNNMDIIQKNDLLKNLDPPLQDINHTQLLSTDLYHGKLAIVRVDSPDKFTTSFFICFKINGKWIIAGERTSIKNKTSS
ncbi:nuclear transport factor 2 family protein [Flagellimonas sp. 2504JD1-5]